MATMKWKDVKARRYTPEQIRTGEERAEKEALELTLVKLRERMGMTQEAVAALAEMTQGEVSRAERRTDHLVSTLRKVVQALGGHLEVTAVFDDETVKLTEV